MEEKEGMVEMKGVLCLTQLSSLITVGHFDSLAKEGTNCGMRIFQCDIDDLKIDKEGLCVKADADEGGGPLLATHQRQASYEVQRFDY